MKRSRILAVVSLDGSTFKPHTGTKTSVLFVQKWNDKLCPKKDEYPIFFAISNKSGKDNTGQYVYLKDNSGQILLDGHRHPIIDHDLDEIANDFVDFATQNNFSFKVK